MNNATNNATNNAITAGAWVSGSDAPEKTHLTIGFMPLTDCASLILACELGLDKKYGLNITLSREASWSALRDKLVLGELDAAHSLYSMIYGTHLGLGNLQKNPMAILMGLNHNGQAITLSNQLRDQGVVNGTSLKKRADKNQRQLTFAHTYPTGTHAMWLYYWLAAHDINPLTDVQTVAVPPQHMGSIMRCGDLDGFCGGEPWNARAIHEGAGFTATTSQAIWNNHPEKVLATRYSFIERYPKTARSLISALLEASRYADTYRHKEDFAQLIIDKANIDAPAQLVAQRMTGRYENGLGKIWQDKYPLKFFDDGQVNYPHYAHGIWFLTQLYRWGLLEQEPDYLAISKEINQVPLYCEVARYLGVSIPEPVSSITLFDGIKFDAASAPAYSNHFSIRARETTVI